MVKRLGLVALALGLVVSGASLKGYARADDSVVTEIRIDDDGVRIGTDEYDRDEGLSRRGHVRVIGDDIVQFGDDIYVDEGEVVEGDVVAILGSVVVEGMVEGDAVAIGGELTVGSRGEIDGDAVAVGGDVTKDPGAKVRGETVSIGGDKFFVPHGPFSTGSIFTRGGRLLILILWTVIVIVLGLIIMAVFRRGVDNVCARARKEAFKMGLIGLLAEVLLIPVMLLFVVTIIGIPIGLFILPLVFALALLFGYIGVSYAVGARLGNGYDRSPYTSMAVGVIALQALAIIAGIIGLPGGTLHVIGRIVGVIGWAVIYVAATVGLGSVIMSKFGTSEPGPKPAPAVAGWGQPGVGQGPMGTPPGRPAGVPPQGTQ